MSGADDVTTDMTLQTKTIKRRDATRVAFAALISASVGYVVIVLAARLLVPVEENTLFVTFWSTLFACFGVLSGLSIETTRAVTASSSTTASATSSRNPRVITIGIAVGVVVGGFLALTSPLWASRVFPATPAPLAMLVCVGVGGYAVHSVTVGALAGTRAWSTYARLITLESCVRFGLVLTSALIGASVLGFAAGASMAAFTWIGFLLWSPVTRRAATVRADSEWPTFARRIAAAGVATGASAVLVVGFPVLLSLTTPAAEYATAAPVLLALSLTRAPLMIPLNAYQGVAVSHFVLHRDRGLRAMLPIGRVVLGVGAVGALLALLVGPWAMEVILGPGYRVSGDVLAGFTVAATFLAFLTLTGALCQALTLHGVFVAGWVAAVVVAVLVLFVPLDIEHRAVLALSSGPAVGICLHLLALRSRAGIRASTGEQAR